MATPGVAKLPCLESQPPVLSRLAHALSRCITTESVAAPVAKALRLLFPGAVHLSIDLPVLPKVLLSTQNLLVEGQCALMFYSLSNTLSGHVYSTHCAASADPKLVRKDKPMLDVEFVGQQLKAHHQLSLPVVLDSEQVVLQAPQDAKDPLTAVLQTYLTLAGRAPVMGTVTLGVTAPLSDRELTNLCLLMASMSKHLASDWKTFFDIADPRHTIAPAKPDAPITTAGGPDATAVAAAPRAPDVSMDDYEYLSETDDDTTSTQSDAAFDGTVVAEATSRPTPSRSGSLQQRHSGSKREACSDEPMRAVRRRPDDSDDDVCGGDDGGPTHSCAGSHGSTAYASMSTAGGASSSAARAGSTTSRGNTRSCAQGPPHASMHDHKLPAKGLSVYASVGELGVLLKLPNPSVDRSFGCFFAQQFVANDRLLCFASMLILCAVLGVRGASSNVDPWRLTDLLLVAAAGAASLLNAPWYTRHRETIMLVRWAVTIMVSSAVVMPTLAAAGGTSVQLALSASSCLMFAATAPLRFSTLVPLMLVQALVTACMLPTVCKGHSASLAVNCAVGLVAALAGVVMVPACAVAYATEACAHRAFRHYRMLEAARLSVAQ